MFSWIFANRRIQINLNEEEHETKEQELKNQIRLLEKQRNTVLKQYSLCLYGRSVVDAFGTFNMAPVPLEPAPKITGSKLADIDKEILELRQKLNQLNDNQQSPELRR